MTPKLLVLAIRLAIVDPKCIYFVNQALVRMFRAPTKLEGSRVTEEETGAAMHAARMADDDFEATYELMLRVAESGDDPISLANECWNVRLSLREHIVRHYAPKPKHEIN